MNHVSFCAPPGAGRIGPTLGIAAELVRRGHRVSYAATRKAATPAANAGATLIEYDTSLDEDDDSVPRFSALLREARLVLPALTQRYAAYVPDLVVYDASMAWWGRLLAARWGVPAVPVWPGFVPRDHAAIHAGPLARRRGIAKLAAELRLTPDEVLLGSGTPAQLVLLPKDFQEGAESFDNTYQFVGHVPPLSARNPAARTPASGMPSTGLPLVIASTGLQRRCTEAFADRKSHAVAPVGNRASQEALQAAVALVSDGDLGPVLSALRAGVPLVVVPRSPEQQHVAARVVDLGLGTRLDAREATGDRLRETVVGVCADEDIAANVRGMRHRIERSGGVTAAATVLEGVLATHRGLPVNRLGSTGRRG
ncbi:glycosyltransferase, MGT family [Amycolatopsis marina]|uniref:Glycosyltransferase, MGT family n=1 Tax=Amycolatopsis marina TaxID=490629 RepID=A0A1I0VWW6_9PSEU|nr:nucleotide disphospho-sugar-binding domain-containing protein [Amycolatopsis marina]SFA80156.1 glycosyltransferase, MGT family [Amycolatopsis marina]